MSGYKNPPVATQFKPGESGNPTGRPVGRRSLSTIIKDLLEQDLDFSKLDTDDAARLAEMYEGKSAWEAVVTVATVKALQGNIKAADFLAKNAYGSRQIIETDPSTAPLTPQTQEALVQQMKVIEAGRKALASKGELAA